MLTQSGLRLGAAFLTLSVAVPLGFVLQRAPGTSPAPRASLLGFFVPNEGQFPDRVAFAASASRGRIWVTRDGEIVTQLRDGRQNAAIVERAGAATPALAGADPRPFEVSYFRGGRSDTGLKAFGAVELGDRWPNIGVSVRMGAGGAERLFRVAPGGRPEDIRVTTETPMRLLPDGRLELSSSVGSAFLTRPKAYQEDGRAVDVAFALYEGEYGFTVGDYERDQTLTIDPILESTYLGGTGIDTAVFFGAVATNSAGDILVTAASAPSGFGDVGTDFGPLDDTDVLVARFSSDLSQLLSIAFFGGSDWDFPQGLVVGAGDVVYVSGNTQSDDLPATAGGYQSAHASAPVADGFVAVFSADLTQLTQTTYYGTASSDGFGGMALAPDGDVLVAGSSSSATLPGSTGAAQTANAGGSDAIAVKFNPDLQTLERATFYGTNVLVEGSGIVAADATGVFLLLGRETNSTANPRVAKLSSDLTAVLGAQDLSSGTDNYPAGLSLAPDGKVYVVGQSFDGNVTGTTGGAQPAHAVDGANADCFVSLLPSDLSGITQSSYVGSDSFEGCSAVLATADTVYVGGSSASYAFPAMAGAAQNVPTAPYQDLFVMQLNRELTSFLQATFLGAENADDGARLARAANGDLVVLGTATGTGLPISPDAYQSEFGGAADIFLVRLSSLSIGDPDDLEPEAYDFPNPNPDLHVYTPSHLATSDPITVSGIEAPTLINAYQSETNTAAEVSVNGAPFVTGRQRVANGDEVRLRMQASSAPANGATAQISIGGTLDTWFVVSRESAGDSTVASFAFTDARVLPSQRATSAAVTVSGINVAVPVEILNLPSEVDEADREISVNGGTPARGLGDVKNGDQVRLHVNAPATLGESVDVVVRIGDRQDTWRVTASDGSEDGGGGGGGGGATSPAWLALLLAATASRWRRRRATP